jgi:F-type H+-transporting ATPase subunit a
MALMFLIFISVARAYKKRGTDVAPRGLQNAMEALILFVKNEIAEPFIGKEKTPKFLPYLLTVFFFIWINNLLGLIPIFPGSANVSGNIAFTFTLALLSLLLVFIFGKKHFWGHIFWYPGVPVPVKLLLAVLEFLGVFTKPFSLMIRLFANITAGHIIIMSIIGITFITQNLIVGGVTSAFSVVMFVLELLVAAIQAYIFTLLTAQMIGAAVEEPHHDHAHGEAHH